MRGFGVFLQKEFTQLLRTGRAAVLLVVFTLFGIMNPAVAKLTPWMLELFSESLAEEGLIINEITVDAMTSWTQFYKNIPIALIIFVLMLCATLTSEYQRGTLIPVLTKGFSRAGVILSKLTALVLMWAVCYWLCYAVTFAYNAYYWDNSVATGMGAASFSYYLFGVWVISAIMLFSSLSRTVTAVLPGCAGMCAAVYLLSILPVLRPYTPVRLIESMSVLTGIIKPEDMVYAALITAGLTVINTALSVLVFNKKTL